MTPEEIRPGLLVRVAANERSRSFVCRIDSVDGVHGDTVRLTVTKARPDGTPIVEWAYGGRKEALRYLVVAADELTVHTPPHIRVSYRRDGERWVGVLRAGARVIVECGHPHENRDMTTAAGGESAKVCARAILRGAELPASAEDRADRQRRAWQRLTEGGGFAYPAGMVEKVQADCQVRADDYLTRVATVRDALRTYPTTAPKAPAPAPAAAPIGEMPDWML
jgi:hypothetical protein